MNKEEINKAIEDAQKVIQVAQETGNQVLLEGAQKALAQALEQKAELESALSVSDQKVDASFSLSLGNSFDPTNRIEEEKDDDTPPHLKR